MLVEIRNLITGEVTYSSKDYPANPKTGSWCCTWTNGAQHWHKEGELHRLDGPAIIYPNGEQFWYKEGVRHRLDGPAIVYADGEQRWFKEGKLHRLDGPAAIFASGEPFWYVEGKEVDPLC
jgi:hypothetical protein